MKYYINIIRLFTIVMMMAGVILCQDLNIGLNILNTSQFSKSAFDNSVDLWSVTVTNITDQEKKYKIKFQLKDMLLTEPISTIGSFFLIETNFSNSTK